MALDGHIGLQQLWDVLGDVGLEGIEDGSGRVVGAGGPGRGIPLSRLPVY